MATEILLGVEFVPDVLKVFVAEFHGITQLVRMAKAVTPLEAAVLLLVKVQT